MMRLHILYYFVPLFNFINCLEPITTTLIGAGVSTLLYGGQGVIKCSLLGYECCDEPWVHNDTIVSSTLRNEMEEKLFGQHIASGIVLKAITSHRRQKQPKKALVLSFHGWTGSGKNYVAGFVAKAMYKLGMKSQYVHYYNAPHHFPAGNNIEDHKERLKKEIQDSVKNCERQLFIFDEMDEMPPQIIDIIKSFIDFHEFLDGVDYRKSTFLFLSNTGGEDIAKIALSFWENGKERTEIQYEDVEQLIESDASSEPGGFHKSLLIKNYLIDFFVPFLPMDKPHTRKCIIKEFQELGHPHPSSYAIDQIMKGLSFTPEDTQVFSTSGCRKIEKKVVMYLAGDLD